nr:shikimate kinase [Nocardioides sambongensis]
MGAGKSTVGALLAQRFAVACRDTDADVEQGTGRTIADLFVDEGEARFRALEQEAVAAAMDEHPGVLSLGGGSVLDPGTRARLGRYVDAGGTVVFLRVGLSDAVKRVGLGSSRPLLLGNVRGRIKTLLDERTPIYQACASHTVDTDGRDADAVAAEIEELIRR